MFIRCYVLMFSMVGDIIKSIRHVYISIVF